MIVILHCGELLTRTIMPPKTATYDQILLSVLKFLFFPNIKVLLILWEFQVHPDHTHFPVLTCLSPGMLLPKNVKLKIIIKNNEEKKPKSNLGYLYIYWISNMDYVHHQHGLQWLHRPLWFPQGGSVQKVNHSLVCFETQEALLVGMVLHVGILLLYLIYFYLSVSLFACLPVLILVTCPILWPTLI